VGLVFWKLMNIQVCVCVIEKQMEAGVLRVRLYHLEEVNTTGKL
jgi:hypothetical protein